VELAGNCIVSMQSGAAMRYSASAGVFDASVNDNDPIEGTLLDSAPLAEVEKLASIPQGG